MNISNSYIVVTLTLLCACLIQQVPSSYCLIIEKQVILHFNPILYIKKVLTFDSRSNNEVKRELRSYCSCSFVITECQVDCIALWDTVFHTVHSGCTFWQMLHHSSPHAYKKLAQYCTVYTLHATSFQK